MDQSVTEVGEEFLSHFGKKGMKWGIRNDKGHEGEKATNRQIRKADRQFERDTLSGKAFASAWNKSVANEGKGIAAINNKPEYKKAAASGDLLNDTPIRAKYLKEHQNAFLVRLNAAAKAQGTNASGTKELSVVTDMNGNWGVRAFEVQHAGDFLFVVKVKYDSDGSILSLAIEEPVSHGAQAASEFLEHHGVKGMKWGIRTKGKGGLSKSEFRKKIAKGKGGHENKRNAKSSSSSDKTASMSDEELKIAIDRIQMEKQFKSLTQSKSKNEKVSKVISSVSSNTVKIAAAATAAKQIHKLLNK